MIGVLKHTIDDLFKHYKSQVFKMLGMFESKDTNGFKYAIRILSEMGQLPSQLSKLNDDYRYNIGLAKVEVLAEELYFLDGESGEVVRERSNVLTPSLNNFSVKG